MEHCEGEAATGVRAEQQLTQEEMESLSRTLQTKAVILAIHQMLSPALSSVSEQLKMFELMLCNAFGDVNVSALLEENLQNQESRAAGVKIDVDGDDGDNEGGRDAMLIGTVQKGSFNIFNDILI